MYFASFEKGAAGQEVIREYEVLCYNDAFWGLRNRLSHAPPYLVEPHG